MNTERSEHSVQVARWVSVRVDAIAVRIGREIQRIVAGSGKNVGEAQAAGTTNVADVVAATQAHGDDTLYSSSCQGDDIRFGAGVDVDSALNSCCRQRDVVVTAACHNPGDTRRTRRGCGHRIVVQTGVDIEDAAGSGRRHLDGIFARIRQ